MVFGRSRKRDSWSSRPLSMLITDNVKLFSKRSRPILEKVSNDQRYISAGKASGHSTPVSPRPPSESAFAQPAQVSAPTPVQPPHDVNPMGFMIDSTPTIPTPSNKLNNGSENGSTPFLTLNLGDSKSSLQDLSNQLGDLNVSPTDSVHSGSMAPRMVPARSTGSKRDSMLFLPMPTANDTLRNAEPIMEADDDLGDTSENSNISHPSNFLWAADLSSPAESLASNGSATIFHPEHTHSDDTLDSISFSSKSPDLEPSNRQDSTLSAATDASEDSLRLPNEYVLNSNVKVVVNRGVFLFDPADNQDCLRTLKLSDDESFNPFEYE